MKRNNDRWSALSMRDRARLIKLYVNNGITDISTIKNHYNKFDEGGEKVTTIIPKGKSLKDLAYLIGSDSRVSSKGYATFEDLKRIFNKEYSPDNPLDDNKLLYIYGNIMGLHPSENSNGKDYSSYLRKTYPLKTLLGKIKEYEGTINPYNEYMIDERDRGLIEELAKKGKGIYSNADTEYSYMVDMYDENMPYRDDVSGYYAQFVNTPNGPAISASDLYDFGPDYNPNKYVGDTETIEKLLGKAEALALGFIGNPYVLRQDNIPIRFINMSDNEYSEEGQRAQGFKEGIERGMLSEEDKKAGISIDKKLSDILGHGYIEPVVVTAERKKGQGGKLNKFETGGPTGEGTATYNHPRYNHKEEAAIYSYLRERGVPHTQASAIMGNIAVESMLDPNISQIGGGGGYGLIQATDQPRKNNFINYDGQPYEFGSELDPETQRQLDYIIDKGLNNYTIGEWRKVGKSGARNVRKEFLKESDIIKASDLFTKGYLRPGKPHTKRRQSMSTFYNEKYTNPFENDYKNAYLFK